jgi:hypothetical protein
MRPAPGHLSDALKAAQRLRGNEAVAYRRSVARILITFAGALLLVITGPIVSAQAASTTTHCVQQAVPANSNEVAAPPKCYATFADAIFHATGGAVKLPANSTNLTEAQLETGYRQARLAGVRALRAEVIIGISWKNTGYGGASVTHTTPSACGDGNPYAWKINNVGSGWNDQFGSAKAYSGCIGNYFEHANLAGTTIQTNWSGGAMNDRTTSIGWY